MSHRVAFLLLSILVVSPGQAQVLHLPPRGTSAPGGSEVVNAITPLSRQAREDRLFEEITQGNVPEFMRTLCPVTVRASLNGQLHEATFYVLPDYLAVGTDSDYFLAPMTPLLAQRISDSLHCTLPTRLMVNAIYAAATVKLAPNPIAPSGAMTTVPVFSDHNSMVREQRAAELAAHPLGELVGGDKKDVVISNKIYQPKPPPAPQHPVVIYGWHRLDGTPIQPLYNGHEETYVDYSHGIRLVQDSLLLDGAWASITALLADSAMASLLSDEGAIPVPRYALPSVSSLPPAEGERPAGPRLEQNYPNPFNPSTTIRYVIRATDNCGLAITDLQGRIIRRYEATTHAAGAYEVVWDGRDESGVAVAAGAYFLQLSSGKTRVTRKMLLVR